MEDITGFEEQMSGWFDNINPFRALPKPPMPKMIQTIKAMPQAQAKPLTLAQKRLINQLRLQAQLRRKLNKRRNFFGF